MRNRTIAMIACIAGIMASQLGPRFVLNGQDVPTTTAGYIAAAEALAADDIEKARAALSALANQSQGHLKMSAEAAVHARDIRTMRIAFRDVSEDMIALGVPPGYEVILCRMFLGGSRWLQRQGSISNPYWGKAMLTCGTPESSPENGPLPETFFGTKK